MNKERSPSIGRLDIDELHRGPQILKYLPRRQYPDQRKYYFRARHGLSIKAYENMMDGQQGKCAICHRTASLNVDHDHAFRNIRGLLCTPCNEVLRILEFDDPIRIMTAAIKYLDATRIVPMADYIEGHCKIDILSVKVGDFLKTTEKMGKCNWIPAPPTVSAECDPLKLHVS